MFLKRLLTDRINRNYLYAFFKDFAFFSAVLVPFFTDWGHISLFQVQLIQMWFSVWVFILEVPTGAVADKIGRKHSIALGAIFIAIAVIVYGSFPHFATFLVAEFLFALGYALSSGADQALLYDTLVEEGREEESQKVLGRAGSIHLLGMMIAAPIGSLIADKFGLNAPTIATSIPMLIAAAIGWSIKEPKIHKAGSESPKYLSIIKDGLKTIRHNRVVRTLAIDTVLVSGCAYFVVWFYQPLLKQIGVPISYFGFIHSILLGSQIFVSSNFPLLERFIGAGKAYIRNSAMLVMAVFMIAALYQNMLTITLLIIIGGGIGYTRSIYISAIANKYIRSSERATVISSIGMLRRFSLIFLNPVIGYAATRSLPLALFLVGLLPLATLFIKEEIE